MYILKYIQHLINHDIWHNHLEKRVQFLKNANK